MCDFYKTRMGQQFYDRTMPELVKAIDSLANCVAAEKREPAAAELVEYAGYLADSVERLLDTPIEPGSAESRDAFDLLRGHTAAVRRILAKFE